MAREQEAGRRAGVFSGEHHRREAEAKVFAATHRIIEERIELNIDGKDYTYFEPYLEDIVGSEAGLCE